MKDGIKLLIQLQELDETIAHLRATQTELKRDVESAEREALKAKQELEHSLRDNTATRSAVDKRIGDLKAVEEQIAKLSGQLNTVQTNKEYAALQHEIMAAKAEKSRIEDEVLQLMEAADSKQRSIHALRERSAQAEEEARKRKEAAERAAADAEARIARVSEERRQLTERIPSDCLQPYERLQRGRVRRPVAACRQFVCEQCHMAVTANTVNLLMSADRVIFCHSCGRILYLPEEEEHKHGRGAGRR